MTQGDWLRTALGSDRLRNVATEASRRRLSKELDASSSLQDEKELRFVAEALELQLFEVLDDERRVNDLRRIAIETFQVFRTLTRPADPMAAGEWLLRVGCLAVLGDRSADFRRIVSGNQLPVLPFDSPNWEIRVRASVLDVWLRLFRKEGWDDLDAVQQRIATIRRDQREEEPRFLKEAEERKDVRPAWELMVQYHWAKAAEVLGTYLGQGSVEKTFDIREQLEAQFDRALAASSRGQLVEREATTKLLAKAARMMVDSSIWTVTRAVNSRVTKFVKSLTDRDRRNPIFEMLPPQRRTLREEGLLGSGHRSVVVSLPTSSGKTFIAEFRILQALNQFDHENGWVAYYYSAPGSCQHLGMVSGG